MQRPMKRLAGKVAIVTGGGSGIGRATARLFAGEGAQVALVDCNERAVHDVEKEIRADGNDATSWVVDLADAIEAERTILSVAERFHATDILINNAARCDVRSLDKMTAEEWDATLATNVRAYFICARTAARQMSKQGGGSIVNIASVQRTISEAGSAAYAASKAGVYQLTRSLAIELARQNILVNSISPGFIRTPMSIVDGVDETTTPRFKSDYLESGRIPLRRAGLPEEIAASALFFASRECGYVTGSDLIVDGGLTITL